MVLFNNNGRFTSVYVVFLYDERKRWCFICVWSRKMLPPIKQSNQSPFSQPSWAFSQLGTKLWMLRYCTKRSSSRYLLLLFTAVWDILRCNKNFFTDAEIISILTLYLQVMFILNENVASITRLSKCCGID